jgi:hypothetical protein
MTRDRSRGDNAHVPDLRDPSTRATRLAANAAAFALVAWAILYLVTTQIGTVRAASPFGNDPWDIVVSYSAIFLPIVVGATWVRSLRHRGPHLEAATASRIRTGTAIALVTIGVNVASDALALLLVRAPVSGGRLVVIIGLVVVAGLTTAVAATFVVRAMRIAGPAAGDANEPDMLDDLLGLVGEMPGASRVLQPLERFLTTSAVSPRRHRLIFGVLAAVLIGVAFDVWHAIIEGPWASLPVLILFAALVAGGVLTIYLVALVPLRLIRPAR